MVGMANRNQTADASVEAQDVTDAVKAAARETGTELADKAEESKPAEDATAESEIARIAEEIPEAVEGGKLVWNYETHGKPSPEQEKQYHVINAPRAK